MADVVNVVWFLRGYSQSEITSLKRDIDGIDDCTLTEIGTATFAKLAEDCEDAYLILLNQKKLSTETKGGSIPLCQHGLMVMKSIVKFVHLLDNVNKFMDYAKIISDMHLGIGIKSSHIMSLMACIRFALLRQLAKSNGLLKSTNGHAKLTHSQSCCNRKCSVPRIVRGDVTESDNLLFNGESFDAWNKFFTTLSLAMVNCMDRSTASKHK